MNVNRPDDSDRPEDLDPEASAGESAPDDHAQSADPALTTAQLSSQPPAAEQPPRYRLPPHPPRDGAADDLARWQALTLASRATTTTSATTWRNGLAGFVTLLTSVLILKGADIGKVESPQNYIIVGLLALGAALSIWGLWSALKAEAPPITTVDYDKTVEKYGSIAAFEQSVNRSSVTALGRARVRVFLALVALFAGTVIWWLSPTASSGTALLKVTWEDNGKSITVCGEPDRAPDGVVEVLVVGDETPTSISLDDVETIAVVESC